MGMMLENSLLDVRGVHEFVIPWKQSFNIVEAVRKGDQIFPLTIVFLRLHKEYLSMLGAITSRIGTVVKVQESMAKRMSVFPLGRILVGSLENLPTKIMLPSAEREFIK